MPELNYFFLNENSREFFSNLPKIPQIQVTKGQPVAVMTAMKMEYIIRAPR